MAKRKSGGCFNVIVLIVVVFALSGCVASSTYVPDSSGRMFSPYDGEIKVLTVMPQSGYVNVGVVTAGGGIFFSEEIMLEGLKRRARQVGADTIVVLGESQIFVDSVAPKTLQAILLRRLSR